MERRIGLSSDFGAVQRLLDPTAYQSTGLCACWSRYGLVSLISLFDHEARIWEEKAVVRSS